MKKGVLTVFLLTSVALAGCEKKPASPAVTEPPAVAARAPAPTMVCAPTTSGPKVRAPTAAQAEATDDVVNQNLATESQAAAVMRAQWADKTFEDFLPTVKKECGEGGKYIVNGDVAFTDIKQLHEFFDQMKGLPPASAMVIGSSASTRLAVNTVNGQETIWSTAQQRQLSYCVHSSFNSKHQQMADDMAAATGAWERVADVKFVYVPAQDANCTPSNGAVTFDVRPVDVGGDYLARAFFPNEARPARNVLVDLSALNLQPGVLTLRGVLRHELGHALGFRHEHTRPESGACFEDSNFKPVTSYDKFSVMHYPQCNGGTSWALNLTLRDQSGAACVYGATAGFNIDTTLCMPRVNVPIPPDAPVTVSHAAQVVAKGAKKQYTTLSAKAGSIVKFQMTGSGVNPGDPDLYVRFGIAAPVVSPPHFNCRPYLTGAAENCELTVPAAPNNRVQYLVHGYTAGSYNLVVTYVKE